MKKLLLALLISITSFCSAQENHELNIDSVLTIQFPNDYRSYDTLNQHVYTASIESADMAISTIKNVGEFAVDLKSDKDLEDYYVGTRKGVTKSLHARLIHDRTIIIDGIKLKLFSCKLHQAGQDQLQYYMFLFVKNTTYSFLFKELASEDEELKSTREKFFSSIKIEKGISVADQYKEDIKKSKAYKIGYAIGIIVIPVILLIVLAIVIIAIIVVQRNKKKNSNIPPEFL